MTRLSVCVVACWVGVAAANHASPQTPQRDSTAAPMPAGTAMIAGVVVSTAAPPAPLRRVRVTLTSADRNFSRSTASDDGGHFEFRSLPAGRYSLQATKAAWLPSSYGAKRPGRPGTPIPLSEGQQITSLMFPMWHGAVITGRVHFEDGTPATGMTVMAVRTSVRDGQTVLMSSPTTLTDDRGEYRIFSLPPGDFLVFATVQFQGRFNTSELRQIESGEVDRALQQIRLRGSAASPAPFAAPPSTTVDYAPVFYPGTTDPASAIVTTVAAAQELTGMDLVLPLVRTSRVEGTVTTANGDPPPLTTLLLTSMGPVFGIGVGTNGIARATTDKDGRYHFLGTAPGAYSLAAAVSSSGNGALELSTEVFITVSGQDLDVPMTLRPSMTIGGRVMFDSASPPPETGLRIAAQGFGPLAGLIARAFSADVDNGAFTLATQVPPGKYRLTVTGLAANRWYIKSSTARGQETLDTPLEITSGSDVSDWVITYTDRPTELAGTLHDSTGRPAPDYFIIAFPTDRTKWSTSSWRIKQTRPGLDGSFSIKGLPAGEYFVAALTDVEPGEWSSPAFLEQIATANTVTVTLSDAQRTVRDFRISGHENY